MPNKPEQQEKEGKLIEADRFSKEIVFMRCHAIIMKDKEGQVIYTFESKEKADEFFKVLTRKEGYCSICGRHKSDEESTPTYECEQCGTGVIGFAHGCMKNIETALCDECIAEEWEKKQ